MGLRGLARQLVFARVMAMVAATTTAMKVVTRTGLPLAKLRGFLRS